MCEQYISHIALRNKKMVRCFLYRNYKPVGFNTNEFIKYEEYPVSIKLKGLRRSTLEKLLFKGKEFGDTIFLYNDVCIPTDSKKAMSEYLAKLEILLNLSSI